MIPLPEQLDTDKGNQNLQHYSAERVDFFKEKCPQKLHTHLREADYEFDTLALILAGGRGNRLRPLTSHCCKPAIPFVGSCRIIDFTLSNCINSGIRRIGLLTQYRQNALLRHIRKVWGHCCNEPDSFLDILPAEYGMEGGGYHGTADAVAQNLSLLQQTAPRLTLILAGDHVYKADYRRMIRNHLKTGAEVTVACCEIPISGANQFGVVETDETGRITSFFEKPVKPANIRNNPDKAMISMGIYVFNTDTLINILGNEKSGYHRSSDFGHDIFPNLIKTHLTHAYDFTHAQTENYWRDVGTIESFFEANMQMLKSDAAIDLNDPDWPIRSHCSYSQPTRHLVDSLGHSGSITDCIIGSGCKTRGSRIRHSILLDGVSVDENTVVENTLILPGATVGKNCRIRNAIIDSGTIIKNGTDIGDDWQYDTLRYHVSETGIAVVSQQALSTNGQTTCSRKSHENELSPPSDQSVRTVT